MFLFIVVFIFVTQTILCNLQFINKNHIYTDFAKQIISDQCHYNFQYNHTFINKNDLNDIFFSKNCSGTMVPYTGRQVFLRASDYHLMKKKSFTDEKMKEMENICFKKTCVMHIMTENIPEWISYFSNFNHTFILISSSPNPTCVPYRYYPVKNPSSTNKILENPYLIAWFARHPCIIHRKIIPLPLGPSWYGGITKSKRLLSERTQHNIFKTSMILKKDFSHIVRMNKILWIAKIDTSDNPYFKDHKNTRRIAFEYIQNKSYVSIYERVSFEKYLNLVMGHKYCLSPPGRGIDTYRTWECLILGSIPIVLTSSMDFVYSQFPIIILEDWKYLKQEYLETRYKIVVKKFKNIEKMGALYFLNQLQRMKQI